MTGGGNNSRFDLIYQLEMSRDKGYSCVMRTACVFQELKQTGVNLVNQMKMMTLLYVTTPGLRGRHIVNTGE